MSGKVFRIVLAALVLLGAALALYGLWLEPSSLRLVRHDIPAPAPLKGLKIAVIADLHGGSPYIDEDKIDQVVALTNAARPDLVLLTGDYVTSVARKFGGRHMSVESIAAHLAALRAPLGIHGVIGNHDRWENADRVASALRNAGIGMLENAHVAIPSPHGDLYLVGIGDHYTRASNSSLALSGLPPGAAAICFTHSPDVFPDLPQTCALTIAGHTHGGQVRLPLLGRPVVPSRYGQHYAAGYIREGQKDLFVSTGIGTSIFPVRLGVPPETSLLTLQ